MTFVELTAAIRALTRQRLIELRAETAALCQENLYALDDSQSEALSHILTALDTQIIALELR